MGILYREQKENTLEKKDKQKAEKMVHFLRYFWGQLTMFSDLF